MRTFAIIDKENSVNLTENVISKLSKDDKVYIFTSHDNMEKVHTSYPSAIASEVPQDVFKSDTKTRNFISRFFKDGNTKGFLHVLSESIVIDKDPSEFLNAIEEMMLKIKNTTWFNCSCDPVNYVYSKFNARYKLVIDEETAKKTYDKTIILCSNANTEWICYDLDHVTIEEMLFTEDYEIAMFYIIEFLASRRNDRKDGEFYYMNMYPTVQEEIGVFHAADVEHKNKRTKQEENELMAEEDKKFRASGLNFQADYDIAQISEDLRKILSV